MPSPATSPPAAPVDAPATNPTRRPTFDIQIEAGNVAAAVPRNMAAIGNVAYSGDEAIWPPARPPTVMTRTDAV